MRDYQGGLNAVGIQNLLPSTSKRCARFAKRHGIKQSKIQLPDGTIAHWLGPRKASKVIILFHGGGYMSPALSEHLSLAFGFARPPQKDVSVVVLQYREYPSPKLRKSSLIRANADLASEKANHYPCQLQQAVSLIEHLLHSEKILPSAITLIGDSAGGHLLLSLILHLGHSNPLVSPLEIDGQFSGAVLISPWVAMDTSAESMLANKRKDILSAPALAYWAQNFLGGAAPDSWNTPLMTPTEWWSDLPVDEIVVMYGDDELLRDDTSMLCEKLKVY